jgi:hypothetical protein
MRNAVLASDWQRSLRAARIALPFVLLSSLFAARAAALAPLGLCPPETGRLDGFMQWVCAGEAALIAGRIPDAIAAFRKAADDERLQATNELAWAGLAAAYCRGGDEKRGRQWATRFEEARQIWIGELDCDVSDSAKGRRPTAFVREQLCIEPLVPDYRFIKNHPDALISSEVKQRFNLLVERVANHCATDKVRSVATASVKKASAMKSTKKKPKKKRVSGRKGSPVQGK